MSPFINDGCPYKEKDLEIHRDIEGQVKMKAEIGVMQLQAKECWGLLATTSSQKNLWRKHGPPAP